MKGFSFRMCDPSFPLGFHVVVSLGPETDTRGRPGGIRGQVLEVFAGNLLGVEGAVVPLLHTLLPFSPPFRELSAATLICPSAAQHAPQW